MVIIFIFILVKIYLKHRKMAPGQDYFLLLVRLSQNVRCSLLSPWSIFFLDDFIVFNILFKNTFSTCLFLNINGGRELKKNHFRERDGWWIPDYSVSELLIMEALTMLAPSGPRFSFLLIFLFLFSLSLFFSWAEVPAAPACAPAFCQKDKKKKERERE